MNGARHRPGGPVMFSLAVAAFVVMIVPILFVVLISFSSGSTLRFPPDGFSTRWFGEAFRYEPFRQALTSSLYLAIISTALALLIGVPATLAIERGRLPGRRLARALFLSPFVLPDLVIGLALFQQLVITYDFSHFRTLLIGHTAILLPYTVRVTGASIELADPALEEAARGLGAGPVRTFVRVTLPVLRPGIFSAAMLGFVASFNNVPLSLLLQSRQFRTLPVMMLDYVQQNYTPIIAAVSAVLLLGTLLIAILAERTIGFARIFGGVNQ